MKKSQMAILVLNQSSISASFPVVRFAGGQTTALTGESLYFFLRKENLSKSSLVWPKISVLSKYYLAFFSANRQIWFANEGHFGVQTV